MNYLQNDGAFPISVQNLNFYITKGFNMIKVQNN